jgi:hypothetical protein
MLRCEYVYCKLKAYYRVHNYRNTEIFVWLIEDPSEWEHYHGVIMSYNACEALSWLGSTECPFYGESKHRTVIGWSADAGFICHYAAMYRYKIKEALSIRSNTIVGGATRTRGLRLSADFHEKNYCPEQSAVQCWHIFHLNQGKWAVPTALLNTWQRL